MFITFDIPNADAHICMSSEESFTKSIQTAEAGIILFVMSPINNKDELIVASKAGPKISLI